MGTRSLITVFLDGEFKVAQYCQWDSYPEGQGITILNFLKTTDLEDFKTKVKQCRFPTTEEQWKAEKMPPDSPQLSRDTGAEILELIAQSKNGLALVDDQDFAGDGLFCEWAYVIDFDQNRLEVYSGLHRKGKNKGRFAHWKYLPYEKDGPYNAVQFVVSWPLNRLPDENVFLRKTRNPRRR